MVKLVARALSNGEIATTLFLNEGTVWTHVRHVRSELRRRDLLT
jgi:DNA-binding CsgD family transcriptional regulator